MPSPSDLTNLYAWLDADLGRYDATVGGSAVTADNADAARWEDQSGNARHVTQSIAGSRLRYDAIKGLLVGSATDSLVNQAWYDLPASFTLNRRDFSIFMIVEAHHCWGGASGSYVFATDSSGAGMNLHLQDVSGRMSVFDGSGFSVGGASAVPSSSRCLIGWVGSAGGMKFWRNGTSTTTAALASGSATLTKIFGNGSNISSFWGIKDLIVYDRALSDSEVTNTILAYATGSRGVSTSYTANVGCVGDSITHGYGATLNRGWPSQINLPQARFICPCYSGSLAQTINTERATLITPLVGLGDVVVVWAGTNDIATNGASGSTVYTSYLTPLVAAIQATSAKVILVTPLPRGAGAIAGEYANLRTAILGNAAGADAVADPIADAALAAAWGNGTYDFDAIHPNQAGYAKVATILQPTIQSFFSQPPNQRPLVFSQAVNRAATY